MVAHDSWITRTAGECPDVILGDQRAPGAIGDASRRGNRQRRRSLREPDSHRDLLYGQFLLYPPAGG